PDDQAVMPVTAAATAGSPGRGAPQPDDRAGRPVTTGGGSWPPARAARPGGPPGPSLRLALRPFYTQAPIPAHLYSRFHSRQGGAIPDRGGSIPDTPPVPFPTLTVSYNLPPCGRR